jgi:hypothetical protein
MNIQLQIRQTPGQISINQELGGVKLQQPKAKMEMNIVNPSLEINRQEGSLAIDQTKAWEVYGSIASIKLTEIMARRAHRIVDQGTSRIAQDGDRLAAIHQSTNVIPELSKKNFLKKYDLQIAAAPPLHPVDIHYTPDRLSLSLYPGSVNQHVEIQQVNIERVPSNVHIGMGRYPNLEIDWIGKHIDQTG